MWSLSNKLLKCCLLYAFILVLIPSMSLLSQCGYKEILRKGRIFEGKWMSETLSFYAINTPIVHGCYHACQYNCRCTSVVFYANNDADTNNCLLYDFTNVVQYLENSSFSNVTTFEEKNRPVICPSDCLAALESSVLYEDASYPLFLRNSKKRIRAVCDMKTDGGGWTLLQRRLDGSVDFYRDWSTYKNGFGDLNGEFWLGLDSAHELMKDEKSTLRFDLWDGDEHAFAEYYNATIANETENYRLNFGHYKGNAGDSMARHSNMMFTTRSFDNDIHDSENCAERFHGAWWYQRCHDVNLNGNYDDSGYGMGLNWRGWKGVRYSLSRTEIKIKRNS